MDNKPSNSDPTARHFFSCVVDRVEDVRLFVDFSEHISDGLSGVFKGETLPDLRLLPLNMQ